MNLVLSGPIDDTLRNLVVALSKPRRVVPLHGKADRLEGVDDHDAVRRQVAALCEKARVDHAYVEEGVRFSDFKLLAMDMDSTLITIECIDEIADFAGKKAEVAAITESAMRGEIEFEESLRRRVALLAGLKVDILKNVFEERLTITSGAEETIRQAKLSGIHIMLLSGGFNYFTERLKNQLNLSEAYGNVLEVDNRILTGRICGEIVDAETKARLVTRRLNSLHCKAKQAIAMGDGANDIKMMNCVSFSVAYHAKQKVRTAARFQIDYGDFAVLCDWLTSVSA